MDLDFGKLLSAAFGGLIVALVNIVWKEWSRRNRSVEKSELRKRLRKRELREAYAAWAADLSQLLGLRSDFFSRGTFILHLSESFRGLAPEVQSQERAYREYRIAERRARKALTNVVDAADDAGARLRLSTAQLLILETVSGRRKRIKELIDLYEEKDPDLDNQIMKQKSEAEEKHSKSKAREREGNAALNEFLGGLSEKL